MQGVTPLRIPAVVAENRLQLFAKQLPFDHGIELVDALDRLQHRLLVLDQAEQFTLFLRVALSHDTRLL
jgi:hypothetical protein